FSGYSRKMLRWMTVLVATLCVMNVVDSCNEAVCASVVSKCMLTQSCKCDLKNCSCCKDCFSCLGDLYSECCSCFINMCPKQNETGSALSKKSHVEEFTDPYPSLFEALTSEPDTQGRWITFTFPVDFDVVSYRPKLEKELKYWTQSAEQEVAPMKDIITLNCTVVYMSQCMSWNKCKQSCRSTGAVSYRWFHDGCCECIGERCINYGIDESRCLNCPMKEQQIFEEDKDLLTYDYNNEYEDEIEDEERDGALKR
ncbi:hypothetical protein L9F63_007559, partial [Diploptera punctata]